MTRKYFGTDGIRGLANTGSMTPEMALRIGAAVTFRAKQRGVKSPRVVIGKDTRLSGYLFESAISAGVCSMGGRALLCGPLPTPAVAHLTTSMRADVGIVISASHNPYQDNGIKLFGVDGFKLPDEDELEIEGLVDGNTLNFDRPTGLDVGRAERLDDAPGRFVAYVKQTFPQDRTLEGIKIVVDAANGAAYKTAPLVFRELGAEVITLGTSPDGKNINDGVGALHPEAAAEQVRKHGAHLGVALDGDADRLIVVDERGQTVDGDALMALCAVRLLKQEKLQKRTLVATVMSNLGLERAMKAAGGTLVRCAVGDRYVVETLRREGMNLGGEQSGHLVFLDHATTGDGLVGALQLLTLMLDEERPLSELVAGAMTRVPQVLLSETFELRRELSAMPQVMKEIAGVEASLGEDGRVLVRWSGTEPKLRVMIEGPEPDRIHMLAQNIVDAARLDLR